jgi:ABC-type methionine transport system ATPase subunit
VSDEVRHRHLRLTFQPGPATEPAIFEIVTRFGVVPSIRRAAIHDHSGWMVLDLAGTDAALDAAIEYLTGLGVDVSRVEGDVMEG